MLQVIIGWLSNEVFTIDTFSLTEAPVFLLTESTKVSKTNFTSSIKRA